MEIKEKWEAKSGTKATKFFKRRQQNRSENFQAKIKGYLKRESSQILIRRPKILY